MDKEKILIDIHSKILSIEYDYLKKVTQNGNILMDTEYNFNNYLFNKVKNKLLKEYYKNDKFY